MVTDFLPEEDSAQDVRMAGVEYVQVHLTAPFSVRVPLSDEYRLYLIRGGPVTFEANDLAQTHLRLPAGSVIALSGILQHRFSSDQARRGLPDTQWTEESIDVERLSGVNIILGRIAKSRMAFLALFERIIAISSEDHPELVARIARTMDWLIEEARRPGPASEAIIRRLAEIAALEIGRHERSIGGTNERSAQQAATDRRILRAVSAFYGSPQEKWSVDRLAKVAGMSRTAFAIRYRQLIGTTPLKSLRQLRMQLAAEQLARPAGGSTLEVTAKRVGYGSDAAFIRAFSKEFGTTPGKVSKGGKR